MSESEEVDLPVENPPNIPNSLPDEDQAFLLGKVDEWGFTVKQRAFIHEYLTDSNFNVNAAAKAVGLSRTWASHDGIKFVKSDKFLRFVESRFSKEGVKEQVWRFYVQLMKALTATKTEKIGRGVGKNAIYKEKEDWKTRLEAINMAFKVLGEFEADKLQLMGDMFEGKTDEEKVEMLQEMEVLVSAVQNAGRKAKKKE